MKKTIKLLACSMALIFVLTLFAACADNNNIKPLSILEKLCESETNLPSGIIYHSDAIEGDNDYLSKEMLIDGYNFPENFEGIESVALRPSAQNHPVEFAVFLCKSTKDVQDVSLFCKEKIKLLKQNAKTTAELCKMSSVDYLNYIDNASIVAKGLYVALIISSDTKNALKEFYRMIP